MQSNSFLLIQDLLNNAIWGVGGRREGSLFKIFLRVPSFFYIFF